MIKEKLGVTEKQAEEVQKVMHDFHKGILALREGSSSQGLTQARREKFQQLVEERDRRLKAILTTEEFNRLKELLAQRRQRNPRGANTSRSAHPPGSSSPNN